jgi:hypothetical protein
MSIAQNSEQARNDGTRTIKNSISVIALLCRWLMDNQAALVIFLVALAAYLTYNPATGVGNQIVPASEQNVLQATAHKRF